MRTYPMFGCDQPLVQICLEAADYSTGRVFGVAEFLSACAILLLVLSVSDFRYRLRLSLAGFGGQRGIFLIGAAIGILLMITEFWFMRGWPVPVWLNDLALVQLILGTSFLAVVLYCCWAVFVNPPVFKTSNASRWVSTIYGLIGKGDQSELAVLAAELERSIRSIFDIAGARKPTSSNKSPEVAAWVSLQLMGDPRMVRALVRYAPWTVEEIFAQLEGRNVASIPADNLATNIGTELVIAENSPLMWETVGFTGYFKNFQPIGTAVFGNSKLVEALSRTFGPLYMPGELGWKLSPQQMKNYIAAVMIFSRDLIRKRQSQSHTLDHAIDYIAKSGLSIHELDGISTGAYDQDQSKLLSSAVGFFVDIMKIMEKEKYQYREFWREDKSSICANISDAIVDIIVFSSSVKGPKDTAWFIHHNSIWGPLWSFQDGPIFRLVGKMVRRKLYLAILEMDRYANFRSARVLGYVLSIMGLSSNRYYQKLFHPLKKVALDWAKKNYLTLHRDFPNVAGAVLIGSITFDEKNGELIKTYAEGVETRAPEERLKLDPVKPKETPAGNA